MMPNSHDLDINFILFHVTLNTLGLNLQLSTSEWIWYHGDLKRGHGIWRSSNHDELGKCWCRCQYINDLLMGQKSCHNIFRFVVALLHVGGSDRSGTKHRVKRKCGWTSGGLWYWETKYRESEKSKEFEKSPVSFRTRKNTSHNNCTYRWNTIGDDSEAHGCIGN